MKLLYGSLAALGLVSWVAGQALPLHSSSRWILDSDDKRVKFKCINWAGHMEVNLPEGLHKQSIPFLADWIKDQGFNCVRLTYSIDHALDPDKKVSETFSEAAGKTGVSAESMSSMYTAAVDKNPFLSNATTRDVFGSVIDTLWDRGVMTVLDNHVSKASWCCNLTDGNGWWNTASGYIPDNSRYFDTDNWLAGLASMASWAKQSHPGVVGLSLRNELRAIPIIQDGNGRKDWYDYVTRGAKAVHAAHPDALVIIGGDNSATDLTHLRLNPLDTSAWAGKNVWEWHAYSFTVTFPEVFESCDITKQEYGALDGFLLEQGKGYTGPLFLSEFGVGMSGGNKQGLSDRDDRYLRCIVDYVSGNDGEWAVWALQGSYYVRNRQTDYDETWGVLNKDWTDWRNPAFKDMLGDMWKTTQGL